MLNNGQLPLLRKVLFKDVLNNKREIYENI